MTADLLTYPFEGDVRLDLDPVYELMRSTEPVARVRLTSGGEAWIVTRYEDMKAILSDPRFRRSVDPGDDRQQITALAKGARRSPAMLPIADPPEHTRLRRLVTKAFTVGRINALRPHVQQMCDDLLDKIEQTGAPADLLRQMSLPMTIDAIAVLLGVPSFDLDRMREWVAVMVATTDKTAEEIAEIKAQYTAYMEDIVDKRTADPGDDLISELIRVRDEGDSLDREELMTMIMVLFVAGHKTTSYQIVNFIYTLLTHPEQWAQLRDDPGVLYRAIEELMRWAPLGFAVLPLTAAEDVEIAGVTIKAGDAIILPKYAANRDGEVFADPDVLDFDRPVCPHLAFGHGPHFCLGAQLARMELQVAIGTVVRRFPNLRLAVPAEDLEWETGAVMRGIKALPVTW
jgi:nocardicin N-oxygenase